MQTLLGAGVWRTGSGRVQYRPVLSAGGTCAQTAEVIALASLVGEAGGFHSTHMRDEGDGVLDSHRRNRADRARLRRCPSWSPTTNVPGRGNAGRSVETLARIDGYRMQQPLSLDAYPYDAGSTVLDSSRMDDSAPGHCHLVRSAAGSGRDGMSTNWRGNSKRTAPAWWICCPLLAVSSSSMDEARCAAHSGPSVDDDRVGRAAARCVPASSSSGGPFPGCSVTMRGTRRCSRWKRRFER